ncbi:MAG: TRAP transporter small permease [Deltaproteobacteria bacterium]|nr:MAG: TRAP transporter small permease [Deltaproteobacteria bacterium]
MIEKTLKKIDKVFTFYEDWTLFTTTMIALITLFIEVVLRYGFNRSLGWPDELVREVIMYTTFIGCGAAVKNRSMIVIDALPQVVPRLKRPLVFVSHAFTLFFSVFIFYYGIKNAQLQYMTQQKTIILQIPLVIIFSFLPMMGVGMFFRTLHVIWEDLHVKIEEDTGEKGEA